jgi:hypothetical protein
LGARKIGWKKMIEKAINFGRKYNFGQMINSSDSTIHKSGENRKCKFCASAANMASKLV